MESETIVDVLRRRAAVMPDRAAYLYLANGDEITGSLTYAQLDQRARTIAAALQQRRLPPGERALVLFPEGLEFVSAFFGCLYAGVTAMPAPFPGTMRSRRDQDRLQAILTDAQAGLILAPTTTSGHLDDLAVPVLATGDLDATLAEQWQPAGEYDGLAYIQYTSGSTQTPKGVMVTHSNLMYALADLHQAWAYTDDSAVLTWMPHVHDYGLVDGLIRPLDGGVPCYIMSPWTFVRRPARLLHAITRYRITHSGGATFAYDWCVRQVSPAQRAGLDLRSWQVAAIGAEPIHPAILTRFTEAYAEHGFRPSTLCPAYGLAEATLLAATKPRDAQVVTRELQVDQHLATLTGCGHHHGSGSLAIVNPETRARCPDGQVGEIWLSGPAVAQGYWNRPQETRETFGAFLVATGEGPFLRTGDLGLLDHGELFVTGRLKDLIIIHGQNYYPQDLEWAIERSHPALRSGHCVAFATDVDSAERIVVACEVDRHGARDVPFDAVIAAIRRTIAEQFELPIYAIALLTQGTLPKTASGKLQRQATRKAWEGGEFGALLNWQANSLAMDEPVHVASEMATEHALASIWREVLASSSISPEDSFFALGGDSLSALRMTLRVEEQLGLSVPASFYQSPTLRNLVRLLTTELGSEAAIPETPRLPTDAGQALPMPPSPQSDVPIRRRKQQRGLQMARRRMRRFVEHAAFRQPYYQGMRRLAHWCGQPWVQKLFYPAETELVRQFMASLGHPEAYPASAIQVSLIGNVILRRLDAALRLKVPDEFVSVLRSAPSPFLQDLGQAIHARPHEATGKPIFRISGLEHLERLRQTGQGAVIAGYHSTVYHAGCALLSELIGPIYWLGRRVYQNTLTTWLPDWTDRDFLRNIPALCAYHAATARTELAQGRMVGMISDEFDQAAGTPVFIGDRRYMLRSGLAELAVTTGTPIVPWSTVLRADGQIQLTVLPPLETSNCGFGGTARTEYTVHRFAAFLAEAWRSTPSSVGWEIMRRLLSFPTGSHQGQP